MSDEERTVKATSASSGSKSNGKAGKAGAKPQATPRPARKPPLENQLHEFFAGVSTVVMLTGDEFSANIIAMRAEQNAHAWAKLAQKNDRVKRIIETVIHGSDWGEVVAATAAVAIPIAARYGFLPESAAFPFIVGMDMPESDEQRAERERRTAEGSGSDSDGS